MNDIMSNLYGPTATQMLGGAAAKNGRPEPDRLHASREPGQELRRQPD